MLAFGREQEERGAQLIDDVKGTPHDTSVVLAAGEGTFLHLLGELRIPVHLSARSAWT